jgi:hypothetical protein
VHIHIPWTQVSKVESEQLEDMLAQAEARCERERALVSQLQGEVAALAEGKRRAESVLQGEVSKQVSPAVVWSQCKSLLRQCCQHSTTARCMYDSEGGMSAADRLLWYCRREYGQRSSELPPVRVPLDPGWSTGFFVLCLLPSCQAAALKDATSRAESAQKQVLRLEGELAALQESHRALLQGKNEVEGGMLEGEWVDGCWYEAASGANAAQWVTATLE